jgi:hypothetical protein
LIPIEEHQYFTTGICLYSSGLQQPADARVHYKKQRSKSEDQYAADTKWYLHRRNNPWQGADIQTLCGKSPAVQPEF